MTSELEEMRRMIQLQREVFERNVDYLISKLSELRSLGTAIGEVSQYDCMEAVRGELNLAIDKMVRKEN